MLSRTARLQRKKLPFYIPLFIALLIVVGAVFLIRGFLKETPGNDNGLPVAHFTFTSGNVRALFPDSGGYMLDASAREGDLNVGEGLETIGNTRTEIILQDGSVVRMDGNTSFRIAFFQSLNNKKSIVLQLEKGSLWVKIAKADAIENFTIQGNRSRLAIRDGVFAATRNSVSDTYRGIQGSATVAVLDIGGNPLSQNGLGLGQQMTVTEEIAADLKNGKVVQLLALLDDDFRNSDWYAYNAARDSNRFTVSGNENTAPANENGNTASVVSENNRNAPAPTPVSGTGQGPVIKVTSPEEGATVTEDVITIRGTVSASAAKVIVDDYTLQKYVAGNTTWAYVASVANGNLLKGKNIFQIYAEDAQGNKSAVLNYALTYQPGSNTNTNAAVTTTGTSTLTAPIITQPNSGQDYETMESRVVISGTVGADAAKVVVNDYVLQKYVSGSGTWSYYADESYGTLAPGKNTYTVYAIDKNGRKTKTTTLVITYKKTNSTGTGSGL